jgi:hypothetical protein
MPVMMIAALATLPASEAGEALIEFELHPATWILPVIAFGQGCALRQPWNIHLLAGLARTFLIVVLYLCTTFV